MWSVKGGAFRGADAAQASTVLAGQLATGARCWLRLMRCLAGAQSHTAWRAWPRAPLFQPQCVRVTRAGPSSLPASMSSPPGNLSLGLRSSGLHVWQGASEWAHWAQILSPISHGFPPLVSSSCHLPGPPPQGCSVRGWQLRWVAAPLCLRLGPHSLCPLPLPPPPLLSSAGSPPLRSSPPQGSVTCRFSGPRPPTGQLQGPAHHRLWALPARPLPLGMVPPGSQSGPQARISLTQTVLVCATKELMMANCVPRTHHSRGRGVERSVQHNKEATVSPSFPR